MWLLLPVLLFLLLLLFFVKQKTPAARILKELKRLGFSEKQSAIILAQAKFESGNFTSAVYKRNNNPFGMRLAKVRKTVNAGDPDKDQYANYTSIEQSVQDLILWHEYNNIPISTDPVQYVYNLKFYHYFQGDQTEYEQGLISLM
jgi:hypothetical protein